MFTDTILLSLKRKYSKTEELRLIFKELTSLQDQLSKERKINTELLKEKGELKVLVQKQKETIEQLESEIKCYEENGNPKKYVTMKAYGKLAVQKNMFESRVWELIAEIEQLKNTPTI